VLRKVPAKYVDENESSPSGWLSAVGMSINPVTPNMFRLGLEYWYGSAPGASDGQSSKASAPAARHLNDRLDGLIKNGRAGLDCRENNLI